MRNLRSARLLALLAIAVVLVAGATGAQAAPAQQVSVTVVVFSYVDVAGNPGSEYPAPACNLEFDPDDEAFATANPLPPMEFVLRDGSGTELARQTTTELALLQRARFEDIAEQESYILQLTAPPSGWVLCPQETADRTLTQDDFSLNRTRVTYHFFQGTAPTAVPGDTATPTVPAPTSVIPTTPTTPGVPTAVVPSPTVVPGRTPRPTLVPRPTSAGGGEEGGDDGGNGHPAPSQSSQMGLQVTGCTGLSSIKGLAFIDQNADGKLGPTEPGLNDVEVRLHGGGLQLSAITPANGQYSFEALGAGTYDVFISPGPEWKVTTPSSYQVTVNCQVVMGYDFGLVRYGDLPADVPVRPLPKPGEGIRLPDTGVMDVPQLPLYGGLAAVLALLGLVGLTLERWRAGR